MHHPHRRNDTSLLAAITWDYSSLLVPHVHTPLFQQHCVGLSHGGSSVENIIVLRRQMCGVVSPAAKTGRRRGRWVMMSYHRFSPSRLWLRRLFVPANHLFVGIASSSLVQTVRNHLCERKGKKNNIRGSSSGSSTADSLQCMWRYTIGNHCLNCCSAQQPKSQSDQTSLLALCLFLYIQFYQRLIFSISHPLVMCFWCSCNYFVFCILNVKIPHNFVCFRNKLIMLFECPTFRTFRSQLPDMSTCYHVWCGSLLCVQLLRVRTKVLLCNYYAWRFLAGPLQECR